ncbi:hypothetical protein EKO27_g5844 [Xylaria grammica]|uniref:Uncharacterized protein n=1 Tax=Xylaria grammica TaxID=363999 RepID=A0A439D4G3_9PEZI|nr:hypothetical protein EKO27_g5844 [Xylaria grammica]
MFKALREKIGPSKDEVQSTSSQSDGETEGFLSSEKELKSTVNNTTPKLRRLWDNALLWRITTFFFALALFISLLEGWKVGYRNDYETGFRTELQPATSAINIRKKKFWGGIIVNETNQFEVILDPSDKRYTGHPTPQMDEDWDILVGGYVPLSQEEAEQVQGGVTNDGGKFNVVPTVRHNLHCVNYLRKVAYDKWYPVIHEERDNIPLFTQHVEHTCRDYEAIMGWQDSREGSWTIADEH